jgi:hypothetical protein
VPMHTSLQQSPLKHMRPPFLALLGKRVRACAHAHLTAAASAGTYAPTFPRTPRQARARVCPCTPHCGRARWNICAHLSSHSSASACARVPMHTSLQQSPLEHMRPPFLALLGKRVRACAHATSLRQRPCAPTLFCFSMFGLCYNLLIVVMTLQFFLLENIYFHRS